MNPLSLVIGVLSFNDTGGRLSAVLRKLYFAIGYNTTFPVNAMLALGSMSPYVVYLAWHGTLTWASYVAAFGITLISAYFYNLIYIVNDVIDRRKDERLNIPKQTARHVLGEHYLGWLVAAYAAVILIAGLAWPHLALPLAAYGLVLMAISVVHSHAGKYKTLTIFVERWAKFCAPFFLVYAAVGGAPVRIMLIGAMAVYPLGFTLDYAYAGYLRDRLKLGGWWRWLLYGLYWLAVLALVQSDPDHDEILFSLRELYVYIIIYFTTVTLTNILAASVPFRFLDGRYPAKVAGEKRRLLTYGLIQLMIALLGAVYATVH